MIASPAARLGRLLLAAGCSVAVCPAAGCTAASQHVSRPGRAVAGPVPKARRSRPSRGGTVPVSVVPAIGGHPARLAGQLTSAEAVLGGGGASAAAMARQALIVQLACLRLAAHPGWAGAVIEQVVPAQRAAAAAEIAATPDLVALTPPAARLPRWRIVPAENLAALRADYRAAQAATGVGWPDLGAINFVETDFGRVAGLSSADAEGPCSSSRQPGPSMATAMSIAPGRDLRRCPVPGRPRRPAASAPPVRLQPELAVCRRGAALRPPAAR